MYAVSDESDTRRSQTLHKVGSSRSVKSVPCPGTIYGGGGVFTKYEQGEKVVPHSGFATELNFIRYLFSCVGISMQQRHVVHSVLSEWKSNNNNNYTRCT